MAKLPPININRLNSRMDLMGINQTQLAKMVGIDPSTISDIRHGRSQGSKHLPIMARYLNCSVDYLVGLTNSAEDKNATCREEILFDFDAVQITELDLRLGMGALGFMGDTENTADKQQMIFSRTWIRKFTLSDPEKLYFAQGIGDSMEPTIKDMDICLIDTTDTDLILQDKVYAIIYYGAGQIKRLRRYKDGYQILSDNPQVPPADVADGEMSVIGRVVAVIRTI